MEDIIKIIIASFSSLWKVKKYGKTIEIITPFFTTNDCFVSVFLTEREGYYIITDGGWISENYYKMLEQPREMGEMTLKDFVPMSLRCQMRSNRKSGKCKEKQNIAGERFANHYPRRCKI